MNITEKNKYKKNRDKYLKANCQKQHSSQWATEINLSQKIY